MLIGAEGVHFWGYSVEALRCWASRFFLFIFFSSFMYKLQGSLSLSLFLSLGGAGDFFLLATRGVFLFLSLGLVDFVVDGRSDAGCKC